MTDGASRWQGLAGHASGDDYADRFARLAATGADMHGEADLVQALAPPRGRVLDAGCGTGRVAIELHHRRFEVVGVDLDPSMLAVARRTAPHLPWVEADLASLDLASLDLAPADAATTDGATTDCATTGAHPDVSSPFDLVVAAGNVVPLLAAGTEARSMARLAAHLVAGGMVVTGFGLDAAHLPLDEAPFTIDQYDRWCTDAGLVLVERFATWDGDPWDRGGYAVSVHRSA